MSFNPSTEKVPNFDTALEHSSASEDKVVEDEQLERITTSGANLVYDSSDEEPELHARTYVAVAAMFLLNLVQVFGLQGPPAVVRDARG
jgi:hypothetical protein